MDNDDVVIINEDLLSVVSFFLMDPNFFVVPNETIAAFASSLLSATY